MSVLDIFGVFLGWCPKFNATPEQLRAGEEKYRGSTGLFVTSAMMVVAMTVLYFTLFARAQSEGTFSDGVVRTELSFLLVGSIIIANLSRILWKINKLTIPMSDWRTAKRVYLTSFVIMITTSLIVGLYLPKALIDWNYPIIYLSYIVTNYAFARRIVRKDLQ